MNRTVSDFLERDTRARWVALATSMLVTAACGFILEWSGVALATAQIVALCAGILVLAAQIAIYTKSRKRILIPYFCTFEALSRIVLSLFGPSPASSALLNFRLQWVTDWDDPKRRVIEARHAVQCAVDNRVKLTPELLSHYVMIEGRGLHREDWERLLRALNLIYAGEVSPPETGATEVYLGKATISGRKFEGVKVVYRGDPVTLRGCSFENTTFDVMNNVKGRRFVRALLGAENNTVSVAIQ